jgi:cobaltochelatase CobN
MKNKYIFLAKAFLVITYMLLSMQSYAQIKKTKIAFISSNIAFHVPELLNAEKKLKDTLSIDCFGIKSKELPNIEKLNPAQYDIIIVEKGNDDVSDWYKKYKNILKSKKLYVYEPSAFDGNINPNEYPDMAVYIKNGGTDNALRMFKYVGNKFFSLPLEIIAAFERPKNAFYHPDAPCLFYSLDNYQKWYKKHRTVNEDSLSLGIIFSSYSYMEKNVGPIDSMIRKVEREGHSTYALMRSGNATVDSLLMQNDKTVVDAIVMVLSHFRFIDYTAGIKSLKRMNVPLLSAMNHYDYNQEKWEKSIDGLTLSMGAQLTPMFKDGIFEPMVIAGGEKNSDNKRIYTPIMYQLNWRVDRALAWARLHKMKNADKRMMVTFYSEDGGKANVGSHPSKYFNAPASLVKLLDSMQTRGWNVGDKPLPTVEEMTRLLAYETSNVGNWAQGEIDRRVKNGNVVMIPESQYLKWFKELPRAKQDQLVDSWGPPPGKVQLYTNAKGEKFITIPKLVFGNVLLAPNPDWGYLQNSKMLYSNTMLPPSHQYYAFYCWFQKVYQPHVRFSIFNNLELMEHKFAGPAKTDWLGMMTGNYPNIHIGNIMAGLAFKEIMSDLPITYLVGIVPSSLNPNLNELRLKIKQLNDQIVPELKEALKKGIYTETKKINLEKELSVNLETVLFDDLLAAISKYLYKVDVGNMPNGTHTLGEVPEGKVRIEMVKAMLGPEFLAAVTPLLKDTKSDDAEAINNFLIDVLTNNVAPATAQKSHLKKEDDGINKFLLTAQDYQQRIEESKKEITHYLDAFEGKYVTPSSTDDPVRNPNVLPTGKNPYSFDPATAPTQEAWEIAKQMGDEMIRQYRVKNNAYPRKVGFVLWSSEIYKNRGVLEAQILYLMGTKPVWDSKSNVVGVEIIPKEELKRPRIDVVATTSGDYRDMFQDKAALIEEAVTLIANLDESENYVRTNSLLYIEQLKKVGRTEEDAKRISNIRVFSPALGTYATSLQNVTKANDTWKNDTALSDLYINRMGHAYGSKTVGDFERSYFVNNLQSVDAAAFSRSSNIYGLLDASPEPAAFFGGLQMAVRNSNGGKNIDMFINNLRNTKGATLETLENFYNNEMQSRAFNPKWIKAMMDNSYSGAHYMQNISENLWVFNITSPNIVKDKDWDEMNEVFVKDKFGLGLNEFFEKSNPYAKQTIMSTMLGAAQKGYWKASPEQLAQLSTDLANSVAKNGAGCSNVICNTIGTQNFAINNLMALPNGEALAQAYKAGINKQIIGENTLANNANVSNNEVPAINSAPRAINGAVTNPVANIANKTISKKNSSKSLTPTVNNKQAAPLAANSAAGRQVKQAAVAPARQANGTIVQGNEIVTTSQKSISSVKEADLSPKNYKNLLLLGFFLIAILFLGWLNQGRNNV